MITGTLVTLDLNGFMIFGSTSCSGDPLSCAPTGSGIGIDASSSYFVTIRNGTVAAMGQKGIDAGNFALISDVRAVSNGAEGIRAAASRIDRSQAIVNGGSGIVSINTSVTNSLSSSNGQDGISVSNDGVVLTGNVCRGNGDDGIDVGDHDALIESNVLSQNDGYGLNFAFSDNAYKDNVIQNNAAGTVQGGGIQTGTNLCDGSTTCP